MVSLSLRIAVLGQIVLGFWAREEAAPVHEGRDARSTHAGQGRRYVVVADELVVTQALRDPGAANYQREVSVLLVGLELAVPEAVLAEVVAVVGVEHEVGVAHLALAPEQVRGLLYEAIHPHQRAQPVGVVLVHLGDVRIGELRQIPHVRWLV